MGILLLQGSTQPLTLTVVAVLTAVGAGGIVLALLNRFWQKRDARKADDGALNVRVIDERGKVTQEWYAEVVALRQEMKEQEERFDSRAQKYESRITELEQRLDALREANTSLRIQSADVQGKLDALQVRYGTLEAEQTALRAENVTLRAENATLKAQYEEVLGELAEMRKRQTGDLQ